MPQAAVPTYFVLSLFSKDCILQYIDMIERRFEKAELPSKNQTEYLHLATEPKHWLTKVFISCRCRAFRLYFHMEFLPIDIKEINNVQFADNPECGPVLEAMKTYYQKIGFNKPWIGYFVSNGRELVGVAGFKGLPKDGKIEIAYGTFKDYEGKGVGTIICRHLVSLAQQTDPGVRITARTLQDGHASIAVLKKNGFRCMGIVRDEEDGDVFEWELSENNS